MKLKTLKSIQKLHMHSEKVDVLELQNNTRSKGKPWERVKLVNCWGLTPLLSPLG